MKFIAFHVPDDQAFLAGVGRVSLCHGHLDHTLRLLIETLAGISVPEARLGTAGEGSAALRDTAKRLAKAAFLKSDEPTYLRVCALLSRAKTLTGDETR